MKSRKYASLLVGAFLLSLALLQTAGAAIRPSALTLSPMIGAQFFDNDQNMLDRPSYNLGIAYNFTERFASELNLSYVVTKTASGVKDDVKYAALRLDLLYHFPLSRDFIPYIAIGAGEAFVMPERIAQDNNFIAGYGGGVKYFITDDVALRCDVRHLLDINDTDTQRSRTVLNNFTATAGILVQFGGQLGHPQVQTKTSAVESFSVKEAPENVRTMKTFDADGDGIDDRGDLCPDTPVGVNVDTKGCPVVTDTDSDGVVDTQDACPNTPAKTVVDARGCPKQVVLVAPVVTPAEPVLTFYLKYLPNDREVSSAFAAEMQKMADFVKANTGRRFVIEGHTDSVGNDADNMKLSQLRAEKIKSYLVEKLGVPSALLEARGFGESKPVADNSTQDGRQKNRRVIITAIPR